MANAALKEMWRKYRGWSMRARILRDALDRWRLIVLSLTVAGAVLATLASQLSIWIGTPGGEGPYRVIPNIVSALSAVSMALAAYFGRSILDPTTERQWLRARALAETCKSESYRFATGTAPYDSVDAGQRLLEKLQQFLVSGADTPAVEVDEEEAIRALPSYPLSIDAYAEERVRDQIDCYYRPKAAENERKATSCAQWVQGISAVAAVLAALGAMSGERHFDIWVAVLGTVSAAIGSHALSQRFQRLAVAYRVTADRLAVRLAIWRITAATQPDGAAGHALVADVESILAAENEAWLAEFLKSTTAPPAAHPRDGAG
ncbi:DUF4231 domain-containing protein [Sinorhizobium meliloti]|uniref:DUF4231 domain-containing protein n=1 Tax=Rhizobium meliloti TaxID=382 RepID=UPI000FD8E849|nr:DUF4231 domain-containing protein [Sinorhizobium meliloti]RVM95935.1 DUF4231 domain-containing protein [Sinorhizobium meliloti]